MTSWGGRLLKGKIRILDKAWFPYKTFSTQNYKKPFYPHIFFKIIKFDWYCLLYLQLFSFLLCNISCFVVSNKHINLHKNMYNRHVVVFFIWFLLKSKLTVLFSFSVFSLPKIDIKWLNVRKDILFLIFTILSLKVRLKCIFAYEIRKLKF